MLDVTCVLWLGLLAQTAPAPERVVTPSNTSPPGAVYVEGEDTDDDEKPESEHNNDEGAAIDEPSHANVIEEVVTPPQWKPASRESVAAAQLQMGAPFHRTKFELGRGLTFNFDENKHTVGVGGFIQPSWTVAGASHQDTDQIMQVRRAFLTLHGEFFDNKLAFFVQTDFSRSDTLLDAWVAYRPSRYFNVAFGQGLTPTNNREALFMESQLTFTDRSLLSRSFTNTGREFGVFANGDIPLGQFIIRPQIAITSGDGRNSFGSDSRDRDLGGLKWGGRLDLLPFGDFELRNRNTAPDFAHEKTPKLLLGVAGSYNDGASEKNGAGHGEFALYDRFGQLQQPDLRQWRADLLAKWMGFSLLAEFVDTSATSLQGTFVDAAASTQLVRGQISNYLNLGEAYNVQLGYFFDFGLGLDGRYTQIFSEFDGTDGALLQNTKAYGFDVAYYFIGQALKTQLAFDIVDANGAATTYTGELMVQLIL